MKFRHLIVVLSLAAIIGYAAYQVITYEPAPYRQFFIRSDIAVYTALILREEDPSRFAEDLVYGDPSITILGKNSPIYIQILKSLYFATDQNFDTALRWYGVLLLAVYLVGMYGLLFEITHRWTAALPLALISYLPSGLYISGQVWGIPQDIILASHAAVALLPWYGWLTYRWWLSPDITQTAHFKIFLLGILGGLYVSQIHGVIAGATLQLIGVLGIMLILMRRRNIFTLPSFLAGFAVNTLLGLFLGQSSNLLRNQPSPEGAHEVIRLGQATMVYPWAGKLSQTLGRSLTLETAEQIQLIFFIGYFLLTLLALSLLYRTRRRAAWIFLYAIQWSLIGYFVHIGWLPLILFLYFCFRTWRNEITPLEQGLLFAAIICVLLGAVQQMILYYLWEHLTLVSLTGLLYEIGRFSLITYLPIYGLLTLTLVRLLDADLPLVGIAYFIYMIYRNLNHPFYPGESALNDGALLVIAGIGLGLLLKSDTRHLRWGLAGLVAGLVTWGWLANQTLSSLDVVLLLSLGVGLLLFAVIQPIWWRRIAGILWIGVFGILLLPRQQVTTANEVVLSLEKAVSLTQSERDGLRPSFDPYIYDVNPSMTDLITWVKANTPENSLFYSTNYYSSGFRVLANRPLVVSQEEWVMSVYTAIDPGELKQIIESLSPTPFSASQVVINTAAYGVDYIITQQAQEIPMLVNNGESFYAATQVYRNDLYHLYQIEPLPLDDAHLNLSPDFYTAYTNYTSPFDGEIQVFNPATDQLANRVQQLRTLGYFITLSKPDENQQSAWFDLLNLLQLMKFDHELEAPQQTVLAEWRTNKHPVPLREAGIDYLLVDDKWLAFLSEAELTEFQQNYPLISQWQLSELGITYFLYQVP